MMKRTRIVITSLLIAAHIPVLAKVDEPDLMCQGDQCKPKAYRKKTTNKRLDSILKSLAAPKRSRNKKKKTKPRQQTNLPRYFRRHRPIEDTTAQLALPTAPKKPWDHGLQPGQRLKAVINQDIVVTTTTSQPVRADILSGRFKGFQILGDARLEEEIKSIRLDFHTLVDPRTRMTAGIQAAGLDPRGSLGLEAEVIHRDAPYLVAEFASATAAGFADATIERSQTQQGNFVQNPSLANSAKAGAVTALSRTAERLAKRTDSIVGYAKLTGPLAVDVLIESLESRSINHKPGGKND